MILLFIVGCENIGQTDEPKNANISSADDELVQRENEKVISSDTLGIPKQWIILHKVNNELVIYQRNGKIANTVNIDDDKLIKKGRQEPVIWKIESIDISNDNTVYQFNFEQSKSGVYARDKFTVLNTDTLTTVLEWEVLRRDNEGNEIALGKGQELIIPIKSKSYYTQVEETNLESPESDFEFSEIDFEAIKERYGLK